MVSSLNVTNSHENNPTMTPISPIHQYSFQAACPISSSSFCFRTRLPASPSRGPPCSLYISFTTCLSPRTLFPLSLPFLKEGAESPFFPPPFYDILILSAFPTYLVFSPYLPREPSSAGFTFGDDPPFFLVCTSTSCCLFLILPLHHL